MCVGGTKAGLSLWGLVPGVQLELSGWQGEKNILGVFVLDVAQASRYDTVSQRWPCLCCSIKSLEWNAAPPREGSDSSLQFMGVQEVPASEAWPRRVFLHFLGLVPK